MSTTSYFTLTQNGTGMDLTHHKTERLLLRIPTSDDLDSLYDVHHDPRTNRYNPAGPMPSLDEACEALIEWQDHWQQHEFGYWAAVLIENPDRVIGFGGLRWREIEAECRLNLYLRFRPDSWGHGYASELGRAALSAAWNDLNQAVVFATTRPDNLASIRILERLGLVFAKELQDEYGISLMYVIEKT